MIDDDSRLDALFQRYRMACPDVDPGPNFMPRVWMKIEARRSFWFVFRRLAQGAMTACAALCLLLVLLNVYSASQALSFLPSYTDVLMAEHTAEQTDFTEAIRSSEQ
jgi:hypothetical protein